MLAPLKPAVQTFDDIVNTLRNHLSPKPLVIAERFRFHNRSQSKDESISEYVAEECDRAFKETKRLITSEEMLTHYDPAQPIRLACDASPYGIGCVLSHTMKDGSERPIAFASRSLTSAERNYAQIDREALSLVWGVKKFHHYLYGQR